MHYARQRRIEVYAQFANIIDAMCGHEELNRLLYPSFKLRRVHGIPITTCISGVTISMVDFAAQRIHKSDLRSVAVESQGMYWIYEYEGPVIEMENVKALLSWKDEYAASSKTAGLSPVHGFKLGTRHNPTLLTRTLEHRNRLSLFQGTAGL